jgi:hypothetical protein
VKTPSSRGAFVLVLIFAAYGIGRSQQQSGASTERVPQFENDAVKVWKSVVAPNAPLTLHRHEHPRVIIALSGGTMKIVEQSGPSEDHVWETGRAYWLPANAPNTMHADVNTGDKPIEVMVVELKHERQLLRLGETDASPDSSLRRQVHSVKPRRAARSSRLPREHRDFCPTSSF